ncbi:hypothetical protein ANCDUO_11299 [Ancylostoma duodenale]|uniref:Uncharacterized protein n=1 Tax=Ancylostoma duodenale TaxID=51022 RepID=A0A0C2GI18_9BILA|nr:hypothetical protein ANCDUO_11299 [Ancylostoma duodenale]
MCRDLEMTIEDEGIEPDFELDGGKMVGKKKASKAKSTCLHNDRSSNGEKGLVDVGGGEVSKGKANGLPLEILMAKKELKRKLALESGQSASPEETGVPKKKKKKKCSTEPSAGAVQPTTAVVTQKKKKKLLKKKLMEGVAIEEVAQKSLKELIKLKPDDPESASADVANAGIKPKKKKKEKKTVGIPGEVVIPPKKPVQSSSEPPVVVADEGDAGKEQDWKLFDPEKKKKKKAKKKVVAKEQETEKKEVKKGKKQDSAPNPSQSSGKYNELLEQLSSVKKEGQARQMITTEVAAGKLEESEIMTVLRIWRQQKRRKMQEENKEKLTQMDGTLEELKVLSITHFLFASSALIIHFSHSKKKAHVKKSRKGSIHFAFKTATLEHPSCCISI